MPIKKIVSRFASFLVLSIFCVFEVNAINLFDDAKLEQTTSSSKQKIAQASATEFSMKLNPMAMRETEELITVNLPHKRFATKRAEQIGLPHERVTPYVMTEQKGSVLVNTNNGELESITVLDRANKVVFQGTAQADGWVSFKQVSMQDYICDEFHNHEVSSSAQLQTARSRFFQSLNSLTLDQVTSLQSRPGATNVIYIDYQGGSVSGTAWNIDLDEAEIFYDNYSYDNDASSFSLIDLQSMYAGWAEVAEDFAPFDVNITTDFLVFDAAQPRNKSRIIATSTPLFSAGGIAILNSFGRRDDDFLSIGWTFNRTFGSLGATNSHEIGHQMGLSHDGAGNNELTAGFGNAGPIMGASFSRDFVHWNRGDYPNANRDEDDIDIISEKLGALADDHGDNNATASLLNGDETIGLITPQGIRDEVDRDVFQFTLATDQNIDLTVRALFDQPNSQGSDDTAGGLNLSAIVELRNQGNQLISDKIPVIDPSSNVFSFTGDLPAGTYFLSITGQAYANAMFTEYGNGGFYQILFDDGSIPSPDLAVTSVDVNDDTLGQGQAFSVAATLSNIGNAESSVSTLRYYQSNDAVITTSDTQVATDAVNALAAGDESAESINLFAPNTNGTFFYGACVDEVSGEENLANNCSEAVSITVTTTPPPASDLQVTSAQLSRSTATINQEFSVSVSVNNLGDLASTGTTLKYFLSADQTITDTDNEIGEQSVAPLNLGGTSNHVINLAAPPVPDEYYYGACVVAASNEDDDSNNCSEGVLLTVTPTARADLNVDFLQFSSSTVANGDTLGVSSRVTNLGPNAAAATQIRYMQKPASVFVGFSTFGSAEVESLDANQRSNQNVDLTINLDPGEYEVIACLIALSNDFNFTNNCVFAQTNLIVTQPVSIAPDIYEPNDNPQDAKSIASNTVQSHTIHRIDDEDWLMFELEQEAQTISIETSGAGNDDTRLWLYDASMTELAFDNDGGEGNFSKIEVEQLPAGRYFIEVDEQGNDDTIELYNIRLNVISAPSSEEELCLPIKNQNGNVVLICL